MQGLFSYKNRAINNFLPSQVSSSGLELGQSIKVGKGMKRHKSLLYNTRLRLEISLNVNTANTIGPGGSIDSISVVGWMGMRTRLDDVTQFLQQRRGIETG
ncbi:unnamed protein product [Eruca vesicaria subsp. sativa]|uniref:Uncharacterized protein n=1 Tax=Eruca vesicaria subsp. sativa TaxID=29727 RepID=A0ABC8IX59_ERUVS|nr:unnamed protein product [Eruca vesicaria subsp. sativa]